MLVMKNIKVGLLLVLGCLSISDAGAQARMLCNESFSSRLPQGWSVAPAATVSNKGWVPDTGIVYDGKYAMHGYVPLNSGDTAELVTPWFDCSADEHVYLYFRHICKILPSDVCEVMCQERGLGTNARWKTIPGYCYLGTASNYKRDTVFHHGSYNDWKPSDTLATPDSTWWKEEGFDLSDYGGYSVFRLKFVIRKGSFSGSYFTRGWYLDAVRVFRKISPYITLLERPKRTSETENFSLKAKVVSRSGLPLSVPRMHFEVVSMDTVYADSLRMTAWKGDSIWSAVFPQLPMDARVKFRIMAEDSMHSQAVLTDSFVVNTAVHSVALLSIDFPDSVVYDALQPVCVTLKNRGSVVMHNAIVNWSVNGVPHFPAVYYGILSPNATDTIVIGSYVPGLSKYDTIRAWVKMPDFYEDGYTADDSLCKIVLGCNGTFSGTYTVGKGGDYPDLESVIVRLSRCGISGPVTLALLPGDYSMPVEIPAIPGCSGEVPLTITSCTGDSSSVVLRGKMEGTTMRPPLRLNGAAHLRISHLSILPSPEAKCDGIHMYGKCKDIEISHCRISTQGGTGVKIGYEASAYTVSHVRIHDCLFVGGDYALNANRNYSLSNYGNVASHLHFFHNRVDSLRYAFNLDRADSVFITDNQVRTFKGFLLKAVLSNADVSNNILHAVSSESGIRLSEFGDSVRKLGSICNNVILMVGSFSYFGYEHAGIYLGDKVNYARIFHNTVSVRTDDMTIYGIYVKNNDKKCVVNADIRNNIFHIKLLSGGSYPVYLAGKYGHVTMAGNNYCHDNKRSVPNLGYCGGACRNMAEWQRAMPADSSSVSEFPRYISDKDLRLSVREGMECARMNGVPTDLSGVVRNSVTTMGAYEFVHQVSDFALLQVRWQELHDGRLNCQVCLKNNGQDTLTAANVGYELNGVNMNAVQWNGFLAPDDTVWVGLGNHTLHHAVNTVTVYLYGWKDDVTVNDTLSVTKFVCDTAFTFGDDGADFSNLGLYLYYVQSFCQDRPVTLKYKNGSYNKTHNGLTVERISRKDSSCRLTFCSESGCADSVILNGVDGLYLQHVAHLSFKNLTFVATENYGAKLIGGIEDVEVNHCVLNSPLKAKSSSAKGVMYDNSGSATEYLRSLRLVGNRIIGGCHSIYLKNTAYQTDNISFSSIVIDSNELLDAANFGLYLIDNNHLVSFSYNSVKNYSKSTLSYTGVCLENKQRMDCMVGNRIHVTHNKSAWGIYLGNYLNRDVSNCLIANNEVFVCGEGEKYGVQFYGEACCHLLHNSIYASGSKASRAFLGEYNYSFSGNISGNMFFADSNAYAFITYQSLNGTRDYNSYYVRSGSLAFLGGKARNTIQEIREVNKKHDVHSVSLPLEWDDSVLVSVRTLLCPKQASVPLDLNGVQRADTTAAGCYEQAVQYCDLAAKALMGVDNLTAAGRHPFSIVLENRGNTRIDSAWCLVQINGMEMDSVRYSPKVPLAAGCSDTLLLGPYLFANAMNSLVVRLSTDRDFTLANDTLKCFVVFCPQLSSSDTIRISRHLSGVVLDSLPEIISRCGKRDTLVLLFENGDYHLSRPWDLSMLNARKLVLVPAASNRDSVSVTADSSDLLLLGAGWEVDIRHMTLQAPMGNVISIQAFLPSLSVKNCRLVSSTSAPSDQCNLIVYKDSISNGNVIVAGNLMEGGYQAVRFFHNTPFGVVRVDSNVMTNQYSFGCYFGFTPFSSCSRNTITSWGINSKGSFVAIYVKSATVGSIEKNLIRVKVAYPTGIRLEGVNENASLQAMVANNVVRIHAIGGESFGLHFTNKQSNICVAYNTFYVSAEKTSNLGARTCVYICSFAAAKEARLHGNLMIGTSPTVQALRFDLNLPSSSLVNYYVDYNCYHALGDLYYYDHLNCPTIADFNYKTGFEQHGKYGLPYLIGDALLTLPDNVLKVPGYYVYDDFFGRSRNIMTMPGAYDGYLLQTDAELVSFVDTSFSIGVNNVRVKLRNNGTDTLISADIAWTYNGTQQLVKHWTGSLPAGASADVVIGSFVTMCNSLVDLKAYIQSANLKTDSNPYNDTILLSGAACDTSGQNALQSHFANLHDTVSIRQPMADGWQLGQNVPNPADGRTLVPVVLPEAGTLHLALFTVDGRMLRRWTVEAMAGENRLPMEVGSLAAGVYFYSVEYKRERKVRKMTIYQAR